MSKEHIGPAGGAGQYDGDPSRTQREHAGEALTDARGYPGFLAIGLSFVLLGLFLVALGGGFEGWATIAGIAFVVTLVGGVVYVLLEYRRVRKLNNRQGRPDMEGH